jgi:HSP20 family protein
MRNMDKRMNRLFREIWSDGRRLALPSGEKALLESPEGLVALKPYSDISETEKEIVVTAEVPGVDKKDIKINATEDTLEISAETEKEKKEEKKGRIISERSYGSYYRRYSLPSNVNPNKIKATQKNGVLTVKLPKVKVKKKVNVKVE